MLLDEQQQRNLEQNKRVIAKTTLICRCGKAKSRYTRACEECLSQELQPYYRAPAYASDES